MGGGLTQMKEFFLLQLGKNQKKTFEVSPTLLEYEKDLSYYKSNKAKNELLVNDNQIRIDYLKLKAQINPDMKAYTMQKEASINSLIDSEQKDIELLKNNEAEIDKKMQELYKDFPEEWEKRQKKCRSLDDHIKNQNNVEIVRHIKEHLLKKLNP